MLCRYVVFDIFVGKDIIVFQFSYPLSKGIILAWVCTSLRYIDFENRINDIPYPPNGYMEVKNIPTQHWYIHPS